ncbi:MAG: hypothetical protein GW913_00610 [Myxococcales bacterium]|nr:hypothetical protein [Myxococcales bacterium]
MKQAGVLWACVVFVSACGGGTSAEDAGAPDSGAHDGSTSDAGDADAGDTGPALCGDDSECDDGLFCNGGERCAPSDATADTFGCVLGTDPCLAGQTCDGSAARCQTECELHGDADGDGHASIDCSGDDCDDSDPNRYPDNSEVCDAAKHDEDCDPTTFGFRDMDGDGFPDDQCCNVDASGADVCGTDCEDGVPGVHPTEAESCNGIDDNCDGVADEGLRIDAYHPDCDGDRYGATGSAGIMGCAAPAMAPPCAAPSSVSAWAPNAGDCDDTNDAINSGTSEDSCNGIDDNCDGLLSAVEDADRDGFASIACSGTDCDDTDAAIHPGATEVCDGIDSDCSLVTGAGGADPAEDADGDGHAPLGAACAGGWPTDDCDDAHDTVYPGSAEVCDGLDNDCNSTVDDAALTDADCTSSLTGVSAAVCSAGVCSSTTCLMGWEDCDVDGTNGCEINLVTDVANCGSCGHACMLACGAGSCDEAVEVSAGNAHTCARRASGEVTCWGLNSIGECGDGTTVLSRPRPVATVDLVDAVQVSAGYFHSCARRSTGEVVCWGYNRRGQLGDGTRTNQSRPTAVLGLTDAVDVATAGDLPGGVHSCALRSTGEVVCWGYNTYGEIGDGTTTERLTATAVVGLTDAVELSLGSGHSCARRATGEVVCWGYNRFGQLGDGTVVDRTTPVAVSGLTDAVEISAGSIHTCARRASGQVVCWGRNYDNELGDGTNMERHVPTATSGLADAVQISAGGKHTCARRSSGQVVCWGYNFYGQVGDGSSMQRAVPTNVSGLADTTDVSAGVSHTCALRTSGQLVCWGYGYYGRLGSGDELDRLTPSNVSTL